MVVMTRGHCGDWPKHKPGGAWWKVNMEKRGVSVLLTDTWGCVCVWGREREREGKRRGEMAKVGTARLSRSPELLASQGEWGKLYPLVFNLVYTMVLPFASLYHSNFPSETNSWYRWSKFYRSRWHPPSPERSYSIDIWLYLWLLTLCHSVSVLP
jgi:hypothetical protein